MTSINIVISVYFHYFKSIGAHVKDLTNVKTVSQKRARGKGTVHNVACLVGATFDLETIVNLSSN